jgi:hypothetical protein
MKVKVLIGGMLMCGMASCVSKYKIATSVNADGSCLREIYAKGDSAFLAGDLAHNPYMFRLDSSWKITPLESGGSPQNRNDYNVKISKAFRAVSDISEGLQCEEAARPLAAPRETFQKRFRWFYSYYTFKAVYPCIADKIPVAADRYMSRAEQLLWFRGDFSAHQGLNGMELKEEMDEVEKKFFTWRSRNFYEAYFEAVCDFESSLASSPYASLLAAAKDTLFLMVDLTEADVDTIYHALDKHFKTSHFSELYKKNKPQIDALCRRKSEYISQLEEKLFAKDVEYVLAIPGKLVDANAPQAARDTLGWKVTAVRLLTDDLELTATSREANSWAFALVGFLIALSAYCSVRLNHFTKVKR